MFELSEQVDTFFPKEQIISKPKDQKLIKIEALFVNEFSWLYIVKMLDRKVQYKMMLKLKFTWNLAILDVTNSCLETVIFDPKEMFGILDLRSIGYYQIKQGILQQSLSKYYRLESADTLCEQFNKFINTLKEKKEEMQEKYPWLDPNNERKTCQIGKYQINMQMQINCV